MESNIPIPPKKKRQRRAKKDQHNPAEDLIKALTFILPAQKKSATTIEQNYCYIANNWVVACDSKLLIATPIKEDLNACPHTFQFLAALHNCGQGLAIVQLSPYSLAVNSDPFNAVIPCVDPSELNLMNPDNRVIETEGINLKNSFSILAPVISDSADDEFASAILMQNNSCVATNSYLLVEYWHCEGIGFTSLINKQAASAIAKTDKVIKGLGCDKDSVTFFFEDNSLIKTTVPEIAFPEYQSIFKANSNAWPIPENFFKAVKVMSSFSEDGFVHFQDSKMNNFADVDQETSYKIEGIPDGMSFSIKNLLLIEPYATKFEFDVAANKLFFFGDNIRGVLIGGGRAEEAKIEEKDNAPF